MSVKRSFQKAVSDSAWVLGTGTYYVGAGSLFVMAVVGTVSIDLVLLSYAKEKKNEFFTGYLLGSMFNRSSNNDPLTALMFSPITTGFAVLLSVYLGVPGVGLALLAGWAAAATIFLTGLGLLELADRFEPGPEEENIYIPSASGAYA